MRGALDRHAAAHDASHFLLTPQVVVTARNAAEVGRLFAVSARHGVPLTLRSGGTSLSGQAVTDGILVDVRKGFRTTQVLDDGARVRTQPGVTVRRLNAELARYGRKIGPDPASESACTIGGVVANNSSGMACGTVENTYRTLDSMVLVLPSGTVVDTGAPDADARLRHDEPEIFTGLLRLRDRVRANPASVAKIRQQFAMKNTMGYGLNALLDFDDAVPDPGAPGRRQRRHARFRRGGHAAHRRAARPRQLGAAGVRRPGRRQPRRCPTWWAPGRPPWS